MESLLALTQVTEKSAGVGEDLMPGYLCCGTGGRSNDRIMLLKCYLDARDPCKVEVSVQV